MRLHRVHSLVSVNNPTSLNLIRKLGYTKEGVLREEGDDGEDSWPGSVGGSDMNQCLIEKEAATGRQLEWVTISRSKW